MPESSRPYCLDPGTFGVDATPDAVNESVMILFDGIKLGANKEIAAGDTIYLCAGACAVVVRDLPCGTHSCDALLLVLLNHHRNCRGSHHHPKLLYRRNNLRNCDH